MTTALTLAFAAGMVATVNPCGFAMLPAYLSYFMGISNDDVHPSGALRSALAIGVVVSSGFLVVFGIAGIVITAGFRGVTDWIPWLALTIGAVVVVLGVAMVLGYEPTFTLPKTKRGTRGRGLRSMFGFGLSYAVASLSCTLPVFLSVVATQLTQRSFGGGLLIFVAYAAGMALVLMTLTVVLALGKTGLVRRLRGGLRYVNRISGVVLVLAGGFIVWFWTTEITSGAAALGSAPAFRFFEDLSQRSLNFVADHTLAVALVAAIAVALAAWFARRKGADTGPFEDEDVAHGRTPERARSGL